MLNNPNSKEAILSQISEALKKQRASLSFTLEDVSVDSGVSFVTVSNLERNKLNNIQLDKLVSICNSLNLEIELKISPPKKT